MDGDRGMTNSIPEFALSVRQPWAWAIIHAGKDIENRSPAAIRNIGRCVGPCAIHASKGMTKEEYVDAYEFMAGIGVECPPPGELLRGGIIGRVDIDRVVSASHSPWFFGPRGLVLQNARACEFIPSVGALGLFLWKSADASIVPAPAKWMLPKSDAGPSQPVAAKAVSTAPDLFEQRSTCQRPEGGQ
jgi:hypothetical protein